MKNNKLISRKIRIAKVSQRASLKFSHRPSQWRELYDVAKGVWEAEALKRDVMFNIPSK
jgi:hypothetical protein